MTCAQALERIMVAEPAALRGDAGAAAADPELTAHLRGCGRCRAVADVLVAELEMLDDGVEGLAGARPATPVSASHGRLWGPLAAAAALATVLLARSGGPGPDPAGVPAEVNAPAHGEPVVAVTVSPGRGAAVMGTTNPKITVVWLYERSER